MDDNKDKKDLEDLNPEELMEELKKIIDGQLDSKEFKNVEDIKKGKKPRIKSFGIEPKVFNNMFVDCIYHVIITLLITLAIYGFTKFFKVNNFIFFILTYAVYGIVDYFVRYLIMKKGFKIYLMSFGLINIFMSFLTYIGMFYLGSFIFKFSSEFIYVVISYLITFFVRFIFDQYLMKLFHKSKGISFKIGGMK